MKAASWDVYGSFESQTPANICNVYFSIKSTLIISNNQHKIIFTLDL